MSETERLIEAVRAQPVLYNTSHADFKNIRKREEAWYNISESFEGKFDVDWKKKWKNLKDSYVKCLKAQNEESAADNRVLRRYKTWPWAPKMEFVRPFCKIGKHITKSESTEKQWFDLPDGILSEGEESSMEYPEERLEDPCEEQKDMKVISQSNLDIMEPEIQHINVDYFLKNDSKEKAYSPVSKTSKRRRNSNSNSNVNPIHNDIELILMGYAKTINKFSPKRQAMVKFKFSQILMEAELEQLEEDEADERSVRKKFKNQPPASPLSYESF